MTLHITTLHIMTLHIEEPPTDISPAAAKR